MPFSDIEIDCGVPDFRAVLQRYVAALERPQDSAAAITRRAKDLMLFTNAVPVYFHVKFWNDDAQVLATDTKGAQTLDSIHVRPPYFSTNGKDNPGRFDTALIPRI